MREVVAHAPRGLAVGSAPAEVAGNVQVVVAFGNVQLVVTVGNVRLVVVVDNVAELFTTTVYNRTAFTPSYPRRGRWSRSSRSSNDRGAAP